MDSINQNQPEDNRENLNQSDAVKKIKALIEQNDTCFFCTAAETGPSSGVRPMSIQEVDEQGELWIILANDSHTYAEVQLDAHVKLYFQGSKHSDFLYLTGDARIVQDPEKVKSLWSPFLKVWFTEGENDPRIALMRVSPQAGYYWDNKHGNVIAGAKMLVGLVFGKTLDDSIEGKINP